MAAAAAAAVAVVATVDDVLAVALVGIVVPVLVLFMRYEKNTKLISFLSSSLSVVEEKNCPRVNMEAAEILPLLAEGKSASETR